MFANKCNLHDFSSFTTLRKPVGKSLAKEITVVTVHSFIAGLVRALHWNRKTREIPRLEKVCLSCSLELHVWQHNINTSERF